MFTTGVRGSAVLRPFFQHINLKVARPVLRVETSNKPYWTLKAQERTYESRWSAQGMRRASKGLHRRRPAVCWPLTTKSTIVCRRRDDDERRPAVRWPLTTMSTIVCCRRDDDETRPAVRWPLTTMSTIVCRRQVDDERRPAVRWPLTTMSTIIC